MNTIISKSVCQKKMISKSYVVTSTIKHIHKCCTVKIISSWLLNRTIFLLPLPKGCINHVYAMRKIISKIKWRLLICNWRKVIYIDCSRFLYWSNNRHSKLKNRYHFIYFLWQILHHGASTSERLMLADNQLRWDHS
jgi:hypothetical protein